MKRRKPEATNGACGGAPASGRAVVAYIRVSTASQDYAYQRSAIEQAARARGEVVADWFADVASGGTMDRPELQRLQRELDRGAAARVWVWRLDRLSRSGIGDTLACVEQIRRAGAALASVADGFALEGPAGELVLAVIAWAAQMERLKIRENQAAARARLEEQGRRWGRPGLPQPTIDAIGELEARGMSIREIARELKISKSSVGKFRRSKTRCF